MKAAPQGIFESLVNIVGCERMGIVYSHARLLSKFDASLLCN